MLNILCNRRNRNNCKMAYKKRTIIQIHKTCAMCGIDMILPQCQALSVKRCKVCQKIYRKNKYFSITTKENPTDEIDIHDTATVYYDPDEDCGMMIGSQIPAYQIDEGLKYNSFSDGFIFKYKKNYFEIMSGNIEKITDIQAENNVEYYKKSFPILLKDNINGYYL